MQYITVTDHHDVHRGYGYVGRPNAPTQVVHRAEAAELSQRILFPPLGDPDYLVHRARREILAGWCKALPSHNMWVLDVGGRLQPYRRLVSADLYVAIDPAFEGLLDVAGIGEQLPFRNATFDLVICTQVLNYASSPTLVISEIHRVLKSGGFLFLTVPAIFPRMHDQRWHFMPDGLRLLLRDFSDVNIVSEGGSIAGFCRTINLFLETFVRSDHAHRILRSTVFPLMNMLGQAMDQFSRGRINFATNYSCRARK